MTRLRTLIVDDEPLAISLLKSKLSTIPEIEIIGDCKNGREAIKAAMDLTPDLMFLDIQMPGLNGFDVVKRLQNDSSPLVIFTTAYEQYALDAFEVHAVDYILKPLDLERIELAVKRAMARLNEGPMGDEKSRVIQAIHDINECEQSHLEEPESPLSENIDRKVVIRDREEITLLNQEEIEWIDAAGDYCCIHVAGETHIKRTTLKELEQELDPEIFKRVHRSTIVNLNCILKVIPHTKGEFFLQLGEFDRIKVSRSYKDVIKSYLTAME
ncbi:LytR/AlgR family response regulator transcription factor [Echinimonas agarilytica]|uniref:LytTR family DNA-binding domain-containing protein n=1 Tax=Echinimonas agarilytica TaxID=1215918 RepID=A0AA41W411_9GAMM|nr:LytTR family DNA-binding domain-containing protein [Echinimonas agarilytica]MCM2678372.1 LytTR family DNA-binding domain-containing protein [Echinimonas agarilytica]